MNKTEKQSIISQMLTITILTAITFVLFGIAIEFLSNGNTPITINGFISLFTTNKSLYLLVSLIILYPLISYFISKHLIHRITETTNILDKRNTKEKEVDEIIEKLINNDFNDKIEAHTTDSTFDKLEKLRSKMKSNNEIVVKQRKQDEQRSWNAEGLARFGDILRENSSDMEQLAYNIVKNLVDYTNAIQGGFYLLEESEDEKFFDLVAFYAYGRKKYADKHIEWGKGLIGTSALEKKTIQMKKLPDSYITVTSGLGEATPKNLVVCPLLSEDQVYGAVEIASLNDFTEEQVSFISKIAESTAATISSVRINVKTAALLEETQQQAQAMISQEEEMRQNLEELQATQEEAARQANRFMRLETTVNHTMIRAEYTVSGHLNYANTKFLRKLEYSSNGQVEGKHISMFISDKDVDWFQRIWDDLSQGGRHFEGYMKHITKSGKDLWTIATYTCMRNDDGEVDCILFLAIDSTAQKEISLNIEGIVDAVNRSSIRIEFDTSGNIKDFNESFLFMFGYLEKEANKLNVTDLIDERDLEEFNTKWENIVNGMNFQGQFKVKNKSGEERWIRGAYSAVYDMYNEVHKVIYIGQDITNEKLMEIEFKEQNERLKEHEKKLLNSEKDLSIKLSDARAEMKNQFKEIEKIKIRNERTLEGALDAILTTDGDNNIIFFNQAAESMFGYNKEEVLSKNVEMLFSDEMKQNDDFVKQYIDTGDNKIVGERKEISILTKDGEETSVLILLSKAQVENENTYTAFIQTIEVELF